MSDDVVWHCLKYSHCSYKVKLKTHQLCRNQYNATGLCNRKSCPLANSRYATIKEQDGVLYLYKKTIERQHQPANWWEKIPLPSNFIQALKKIDEELIYWPVYHILKNKQRLTKMTQYLIRKKQLAKKPKVKYIRVPKKVRQREKTREQKALKASKLAQSIKEELVDRLKSGTYGDIYNFPENVIAELEDEQEEEEETGPTEFVEEYDDEIMSGPELEEAAPEFEYELEMEGGKQTELTQAEVANFARSLGFPGATAPSRSGPPGIFDAPPKPKRRKRKHLSLTAEDDPPPPPVGGGDLDPASGASDDGE